MCLKKSNKVGKKDNVGVNNKYTSLLKKRIINKKILSLEVNLIEINQKICKFFLI